MKNDCGYTRRLLRKYLRGHLFKYEQVRVARHLSACPLCRSELQALRKVADTKQLLRDITPPEGLARVKEGMRLLAKLRLLVYRPLWLFAIIGIGALVYINLIAPGPRDVEIENLEKSVPIIESGADAQAGAPVSAEAAPETKPVVAAKPDPVPTPAPDPAPDPLSITISVQNPQESVQFINNIMGGYAELVPVKFSDRVRRVSGKLAAQELLEFLRTIEQAGTVSYSRKRFKSFPAEDPIPFTLRIKPAPKIDDPQAPPASTAHQKPEGALPATAPTATAL